LSYSRYLSVLGLTILIPALAIVAINYRIGAIGWANPEIAATAVRWQRETHGIVNIAVPQERNFKFLSLADREPGVKGVILGASTVQSLRGADLGLHGVYNFAISSNDTAAVVTEAEYLADAMPQLEWMVASLDWVLGYVYRDEPPSVPDKVEQTSTISTAAQLEDTLTLPRVVGLRARLVEWVQSGAPVQAAVQALTSPLSGPYRCTDGVPGEGFAASDPTPCAGFRWDGTMSFEGQQPITETGHRLVLARSLQQNGEYVQSIRSHRGMPNEEYLRDLTQVAATLRARGGRMIVLLPPLLPGLERELLSSTDTAEYAGLTKRVIHRWAADHDITLIDAGASEDFGCQFSDFFDGHHNFGGCYDKIFTKLGDCRAPAWLLPPLERKDEHGKNCSR